MREWEHMEEREKAFFADENELPDDVDCLFHFLPRVEPPQALIQRIMAQTQARHDYGVMTAMQHLQSQMAKRLLEQLVILSVDELDARQLRHNLC